jgi:hypothetical protein
MARLAAALGERPDAIVAAVAPDTVARIDTIR